MTVVGGLTGEGGNEVEGVQNNERANLNITNQRGKAK